MTKAVPFPQQQAKQLLAELCACKSCKPAFVLGFSPAAELWLLVTSSTSELCTSRLKYVRVLSLLIRIHQGIFSQ